jgi:hypothetical protein
MSPTTSECSTLKAALKAMLRAEVKVRQGKGCKAGAIEVFLPKSVRLSPALLDQAEGLIHLRTGRVNMLTSLGRTEMSEVYTIQPIFE